MPGAGWPKCAGRQLSTMAPSAAMAERLLSRLCGLAPNRRKASIRVRFITLFSSCVRIRLGERLALALVQPDLEACAMQSDRLRRDSRGEVNLVRSLRGGNTLAAAVAQTSARVLALTTPGPVMRQEALSQPLANGKRSRNAVHVGPALPSRHHTLNAQGQHARPAAQAQVMADAAAAAAKSRRFASESCSL